MTGSQTRFCQRRQLKQQKYTSTEAGLEYRKVNTEVRKKMKAATEERTEKQCENIDKGMMSGNSKEAHNTLKALPKTQQHKSQQSSKIVVETSWRKALLF